jgi:hypothetical protein
MLPRSDFLTFLEGKYFETAASTFTASGLKLWEFYFSRLG